MHLVALLSWFDEPVDRLWDCAASLNKLCDVLLAVDGRYAGYPVDHNTSPPEQYVALEQAFKGELVTYRPKGPWAGQVAKRDMMIKLAQHLGDFLVVVDADETVVECDIDKVRHQLSHSTADTFGVDRWTVPNPETDRKPDSFDEEQAGGTYTFPRVFRSLPPMAMGRTHWEYLGAKDGQMVQLWSPWERLDGVLFDHRTLFRSDEDRELQKVHVQAFNDQRAALGREL